VDVKDRIAFIIDDLIAGGGTVARIAGQRGSWRIEEDALVAAKARIDLIDRSCSPPGVRHVRLQRALSRNHAQACDQHIFPVRAEAD
jgi:hypothetical protein